MAGSTLLSFSNITNVTSCQPYTFTFSKIDPSLLKSNMTMTAWVDRVTDDGGGVAQQSLAQNVTLKSSSATSLTWDPVAASPGRYFINAWAASNSSHAKNELATQIFDIQAGPDLSCLHVVPVITQTAQTTQTSPSPTSTTIPASSASSMTNKRLKIIMTATIAAAVCLLLAGLVGLFIVRRSRRLRQRDKRKLRPYAFSAGGGSQMAKTERKANGREAREKGVFDRDVESGQTPSDVLNLPSRFSL